MAARFLIEVPHEEAIVACARAIEVFLRSGSHYLTHAVWGCKDGVHKSWMIVEVDSKNEARNIVPPAFRKQTMVIQLNDWTLQDIEDIYRHHGR